MPDPLTLSYALRYAELGLPVFPCIPGDKRPLTAHGFKDATTDAAQIREWWRWEPNANVAAPTGLLFDVVDVDSLEALAALNVTLGGDVLEQMLADSLGVASTPRGLHILVKPTGRGNGAGAVVPGVDYRGQGGYVVLPPSTTPRGAYTWAELPTFGKAAA